MEILVKVVLLIFGVVTIYFGSLVQDKKTSAKLIKFNNSIRGTKTEITKMSLLANQIGGVVLIIFGVGCLFAFFFLKDIR